MTPRERLQNGFYNEWLNWFSGDFKERMTQLLNRNQGKGRDVELAEAGRDFAIRLDFFAQVPAVRKSWRALVQDRLESVKNIKVPGGKEEVEKQLLGPVSVLTVRDMLIKAAEDEMPDIREKLSLSEIMPKGQMDALDKVDLDLRFGEKDGAGKEIVRYVQLKTNTYPRAEVANADDPVRVLDVEKKDIEKMLSKARQFEREEALEGRRVSVKCFVVRVPACDTEIVDDVFGIINDSSEGRTLVDEFRRDAESTGLLPRLKK